MITHLAVKYKNEQGESAAKTAFGAVSRTFAKPF